MYVIMNVSVLLWIKEGLELSKILDSNTGMLPSSTEVWWRIVMSVKLVIIGGSGNGLAPSHYLNQYCHVDGLVQERCNSSALVPSCL